MYNGGSGIELQLKFHGDIYLEGSFVPKTKMPNLDIKHVMVYVEYKIFQGQTMRQSTLRLQTLAVPSRNRFFPEDGLVSKHSTSQLL